MEADPKKHAQKRPLTVTCNQHNHFLKMSAESIEKIEIYQFLVKKLERYPNWAKQTQTIFCWVEKVATYQNFDDTVKTYQFLSTLSREVITGGSTYGEQW